MTSPITQSVTATASPTIALGGEPFANASLYVGDLDGNVNEEQLYDLFSQVAQVVSIRVCRDQTKRSSLGYAYVNFANAQDASNAMDILNFTHVNGKPIRIMFSQRDPSIRKSGYGNVFIKNLDTSIDNKALHDTFAAFGTVLSCKLATDSVSGQSKGYGFVQFDNEETAQNAIKQLNGMLINDKQVYVGFFVRRQARTNGSPKFTNVYVKNLSETFTDEDLTKLFGSYGTITSATIMKDVNGKSRCFGFVNFQNPDSAAAAVESLNGSTTNDKILYVARAQKKAEREAELKAKIEQERMIRYEKLQGANLYLKNLDDNLTTEKLKDLFSEFGAITSCKVTVDSHGHSKGSGFVAFSTPEEASNALNEMNGKLIGRKPLYVAVAQRKEERKAHLQAHFAQLRSTGGMAMPSGIPVYHPGTPRLPHQQLYFGQGTPGFIPSQPTGYSFQPQILSGMRPAFAPNFINPYHPLQRQVQSGYRTGVRRNGNLQQVQQNQNQMLNRNSNQGYRYMSNGRNIPNMHMHFDGSGIATPNNIQHAGTLSTTLASALASATPENQRMMLGEHLYPLVERLTTNQYTAKVTGMLLEMDQSEVINLIESPEDLKAKVSEAIKVLNEAVPVIIAE
ncbi:unnamed protein product [Sphenostylis stenocarpa]|uniref:Polyadenylate-binding protein n=1 Tax=Sphenostylis stenocarpa TaxID=92480 RepID=A0AA87BBQ4_9FABA|nr:unnamed protein product [Sphenostylis stenocarpa]